MARMGNGEREERPMHGMDWERGGVDSGEVESERGREREGFGW